MAEPLVIPIAHDFLCPWCWVGLFQVKRLKAEFGVEFKFEWRGHELIPEELDWPEPKAPMPEPSNKPPILSRFEFLKLMDGIEVPNVERPKRMRMHYALEAVEYIKEHAPDRVEEFVEAVYRAYWERGERIGDIDVLEGIAAAFFGSDAASAGAAEHRAAQPDESLRTALEERRYRDRIIHFDAPSYAAGIYNVPTFEIGGKRYAEQPYVVLKKAVGEVLGYLGVEVLGSNDFLLGAGAAASPENAARYPTLRFPPSPAGRPYLYINMVATIDGKIILGGRDEPVVDLGSETDHRIMKQIEAASDAVLLG
ncbi:MAG TPA: DsbA family protein, partial [Fimbriimonadaceae bacterium]|nr:DsbA family protein [Fimbriimonadaceae bacterium]